MELKHTVDIALSPAEAEDSIRIREAALAAAAVIPSDAGALTERVVRRSIDARQRQVLVRLRVELWRGGLPGPVRHCAALRDVSAAPEVLIIGAGPAGYFAALQCIELGLRPTVLDRGKDVRSRRRDLRAIQQDHIVNPHSNYCFGEGGAGTYSDGKLYTRSHKRGSIQKVLELFVEHGADPRILQDAHPHIGSNKLPGIVSAIRATIEGQGGAVHFDTHVTGLIFHEKKLLGVRDAGGREWRAAAVILATGHSARDVYRLLHEAGVAMEPKPFALGVRVEHQQALIDRTQYHSEERDPHLPASSYKLSCQAGGRGVFSFCMCPGGLVVPAATAPGEIVVNGMSLSRRDSPFANSGLVTAVDAADWRDYAAEGVFAGLAYQRDVEQRVFRYGDGSQRAPAQRLSDFVEGRLSDSLNPGSYIPGLYSAPVHELLPAPVYARLREGLRQFGRQMPGYLTAEANVIATESRTSAPIRIPRHHSTLMHPDHPGLFPCGEGAGYAGGILSAAMDGQNVARAVADFYKMKQV